MTLGTYIDRWRLDDGSINASNDDDASNDETSLSYQRVDGIKVR
jgi:hypothetical protein